METLLQDLRYGLRMLRRSPAFTAMAVLTLALGIGVNTSAFTIYNAVVLRPLLVKDPSRIVRLFHTIPNQLSYNGFSYPQYIDYRDRNNVFSGLIAESAITLQRGRLTQVGDSGSTVSGTEELQGMIVSGNYFSVLGVDTVLGRAFAPEEDQIPGSHPVVILSYGFRQHRLGADPNVVGKSLILNRIPFTVVGVAPRGFSGTRSISSTDVWVPLML